MDVLCKSCIDGKKYARFLQKWFFRVNYGISMEHSANTKKNLELQELNRIAFVVANESQYDQTTPEMCPCHRVKNKQDGRLAPAYFSPNYKYFDQILQTVKNETTVLNLVV